MTIEAKVIARSRADGAPDLITLQVKYPRFVHAEMMTHRVFSRNASSSRAIPIERMIRDVETDPAMPVAWGSNKPGMQAGAEVSVGVQQEAMDEWRLACADAVKSARFLNLLGLHKQIVNRLLEPFAHITVVITATDWDNFFDLRCHPDADPTMRAVAEAMRDAIAGSAPVERDWHLPYTSLHDEQILRDHMRERGDWDGSLNAMLLELAMISAARCARVAYLLHSGEQPTIDKDLALAQKLLESKHASPFEHQAMAAPRTRSGNFVGWTQHRQMLDSATS